MNKSLIKFYLEILHILEVELKYMIAVASKFYEGKYLAMYINIRENYL